MQLYGQPIINRFVRKHPDGRRPLRMWQSAIEEALWTTPSEVKARFGAVSFLPDNRLIFNIKGNSYRLVGQIEYQTPSFAVEWIGTHAEYDREEFK